MIWCEAGRKRLTSNHFLQHGARMATWAFKMCLLEESAPCPMLQSRQCHCLLTTYWAEQLSRMSNGPRFLYLNFCHVAVETRDGRALSPI